MRVRLLALLIFLSSFSFGQTLIYTRTVQGNLFLPPGTPAANSRMRFQLKYCQGQNGRVPVNPGSPPGPSGIVVSSQPFDVIVQNDGSWRTQVYGNDQIVCGSDYTGPSRWLIQPVFNGEAGAGVEYQIQSCGAASPCQPFSPDTALACGAPNPTPPPPTITIDCALGNANPDQPDTTVTVNAQMAVPNAINFGNILLPPANGKVINFMLNGNQAGAYLPGNGNSTTCLSGTGSYVLCGGSSGGGGVSGATAGGGLILSGTTLGMIRTCTANQYLSWNGSAWICTTLSSSGGGAGLPTTPTYDLFTSTGAGAAQTSGILGGSGFLKGQVILATGDVTSAAAPFPLAPNASVEYFPSGASFGGINVGATNGLAAYFSHSGKSSAGPGFGNGGIMLGGGNNSGTNYQVYLDCESSPSLNCDFKVPITVNGAGVGGGGGGAGFPTIPAPNLYASNGAAAATDSGVLGQSGFLRAYVLESTGTGNPSPFSVPNGSVEYFPSGATYGGLNVGATNGVSLYFSHSSHTGQSGNGGVGLAGGNSSGAANTYQIYLDCEQATGCDFKVPVTYNGGALGGGGGGGITGATLNGGLVQSGTTLGLITSCTANQYLSWNGSAWVCATLTASGGVTSINSTAGAFTFTGAGVSCSGTTCTFSGTGGGGSGTVSSGTAGHFTWYSAAGTTVSSNANLDDSVTTAATITSQETIAAPGINVNGTGGIAMTGAGGTLPTVAVGSGGIGVGPGGVPQYNANGAGWTNIGSGGGGGLPTIPVNHLFASTGAGAAQDPNVVAAPNVGGTGLGVIKSGLMVVSGMIGGTSPFTGSNGSQEWYGGGGVIGGVTLANGGVLIFGNSASTAGPTGNGGVVLGGNSATTTSSKEVYVDCEHTGCDFKAPITVNGSAVGGAGAGSGTVLANPGSPAANVTSWGALTAYLGTWVASRAYSLNALLLDSNGNVERCTTAGTSAASAPTWPTTGAGTSTVTDGTVVWTLQSTGNTSTTVGPTNVAYANLNGVAINGALQWGPGGFLTSGTVGPDVGVTRLGIGLLGVSSGGVGNASGFLKTANASQVTTDNTTGVSVVNKIFPAYAQAWVFHCDVPWTVVGASGAATVSTLFSFNQTPTSATTLSIRMLGGTTFQQTYATYNLSASVTNVTAGTISVPSADTSIYTSYVDGVIAVPSAGGQFSISIGTSTGTITGKAGANCLFQ